MSPVSMLEVFALLAQGDIPLLGAAHTHVSLQPDSSAPAAELILQ